MMQKKICMYGLLSAFLCCGTALAQQQQHTVEVIPFGDMDQWIDRQIKESGIIGGALKNVYAIGPTATIRENKAYKNMGGSPWATSNVMARVAGITKTNTSVFPEKRGDGYCARMDTRMESVKVLGIVDITVLAAGSMFLGEVHEPIKGTKNPQKMLNSGIPFSIMYGDITGDPAYKPHMMRLQVEERYAINSKGESVPVKEVAWGTEEDAPTHLLLQFTSSHGGAYIGSPGNSLWIDNVKLVY